MTVFERRALKLLVEQSCTRLVLPGYFGACLWPDTQRPTWAFARPAGNVLNRLRAQWFAEWLAPAKDEWGWRATASGIEEAARA